MKEMEMQKAKMSMNEEEFKQHQKMKRLEAEAQEEVLPQKPTHMQILIILLQGETGPHQTEGGKDEGNEGCATQATC